MERSGPPSDPAGDVLVVGGGPAGLFAALAARAAGCEVTIAAPPQPVARDGRTTALLHGSVTALRRLGVWPRLAPAAAPLRIMRLVDDTGSLIRAPLFEGRAAEIGLDAFGFNVVTEDLTAALRAAVADAGIPVVEQPVAGLDLSGARPCADLGSGRRHEAALIVGADGRHSVVRRAAGIEALETRYRQVAVTAICRHSRPHHDASTEFHTRSGPFTLVPLPGERSSLVCVVSPAEADRLLALDDRALGREIERRSQAILGKVLVEPGRGRFALMAMVPKAFGVPGVALAGEAAHVLPPIGAQGLNLSFRDGAVLADVLADALARGDAIGGAEAMAAYDLARRADIVSRSGIVHALNWSLLSGFALIDGARSAGLHLLTTIGPLRRAFMREGLAPSPVRPRLMRAEDRSLAA